MNFLKWYAVIVLLVVIIFGWLYLKENRYFMWGTNGYMFDTWDGKIKEPSQFIGDNLAP